MKHTLLRVVATLAVWASSPAGADDPGGVTQRQQLDIVGELQACRGETDRERRLVCFDDLARRNAPARFAGKLGMRTDTFHLQGPHILRFRSDGVIFVLYVLDAKGEVVQNLHIGGSGEDSYLIEQAGTYSLQIDGSAEWRIWLDPASDQDEKRSTSQ